MQVGKEARPRLAGEGRATTATTAGAISDSTRFWEPTALTMMKRGREICVGKVTYLDDVPILAVAVRNQKGTSDVISVPVTAVTFAERMGCQWLYWRYDREPRRMRRVDLGDLRNRGWHRPDGEVYIRLDAMEQVRWRSWEYAERTLSLDGMISGQ